MGYPPCVKFQNFFLLNDPFPFIQWVTNDTITWSGLLQNKICYMNSSQTSQPGRDKKIFDSKIEQDFSNWTNSDQNIELSNYDKTSLNHVKFRFLSPAYLDISRVGDDIVVDQETGVVL